MKILFFISYVFIYLEFIAVLSRFDKLNDRTAECQAVVSLWLAESLAAHG
jgi:hypothetical protein